MDRGSQLSRRTRRTTRGGGQREEEDDERRRRGGGGAGNLDKKQPSPGRWGKKFEGLQIAAELQKSKMQTGSV